MKFRIFSLLIALSIIPQHITSKALIWDLGFTLIEPNHFYIARQIGLFDCFALYLTHGSNAFNVVNDSIFDILMDGKEDYMACVPYDPEGRLMPNHMCNWIKSIRTNGEIMKEALANAQKYKDYTGTRHKRLVHRIIRWMFTPREFAYGMRPIHKATKLLRDCARAKDAHGKPRNTFYILSNWDEESFQYLYTNPANKPIFKYFDHEHVFISGFFKDLKPHPPIFKHMLEKFNLDPKDCVFIDDQVDNVRSARSIGLPAVQLRNGDFRLLKKQLKELGVL